MFKNYDSLGFHTRYYRNNVNDIELYKTFKDAKSIEKEANIDVVSIIEFINRFYFFGDRTIVDDIYQTPWLSRIEDGTWKSSLLSNTKTEIKSEKMFMRKFLCLIENEIKSYIGESKNVGILLSGGMDSRIVAAIVNKLNIEHKMSINVTALTWGIDNSRDVIYSKKIADMYDWKFIHHEITPETLYRNISITAENGCEYSPVHLHNMHEVSNQENIDLILAGSFGDSIGRAEYSGKHASELKSIGGNIQNKFQLLNNRLYSKYFKFIDGDLNMYYDKYPEHTKQSQFELERQIHYMRKELNSCMSIIDNKIPLYQVFTSPETYNVVFNTDYKYRTDNLYYLLLEHVDKELLTIPWARTGKPYLYEGDYQVDNYAKNYHNYGKWIKEDLSKEIEKKILNGNLESLNIFNISAIKNMMKYNKKYGTNSLNRADELLIWLASLSDMLEIYTIEKTAIQKDNFFNRNYQNILSKCQLFIYLNGIRLLK
jgi:hypothetical protein